MRKAHVILFVLGLLFILVLSACSSAAEAKTEAQKPDAAPAQMTETDADHQDGDAHGEADHNADDAEAAHQDGDEHEAGASHDEEGEGDHDAGAHGVPNEGAAVPNPIEASDESIEIGREIYAANCVACHGESGEGDGPAAAGFDPPPANLHEDHVQVLSDGALFYIIQNGVEDTGMPAWGDTLDEEQIWHVVNFIRTFGE